MGCCKWVLHLIGCGGSSIGGGVWDLVKGGYEIDFFAPSWYLDRYF